jgi:hypothetical protein
MKNKNIIKTIVIILAVLVVLVFGYKLFTFYRYTVDKPDNVENVVKGLKNQKILKINKQELSENEYITVKNIKMKNILDDYEEVENVSTKTSYKKESNGNSYVINYLGGYLNISIIDGLTNHIDEVWGNTNYGFLKGNIKDIDMKDFLKRNNINNDIDFYKFVANHYYIESNLFTDTKTLKENYAFNLYTSSVVPEIDGWTILDGDVKGYITENSNKDGTAFQICIIDNDKRYIIVTDDPRFKDESFMRDVISTIEIIK